MHYHISILITNTILSNTQRNKKGNKHKEKIYFVLSKSNLCYQTQRENPLNQYYQLHHLNNPLQGNSLSALSRRHLCPLVSFAQLCTDLLFDIWLLTVAHRQKVNFLCTTLLSWGCNTALLEGAFLYLGTFLLALRKK